VRGLVIRGPGEAAVESVAEPRASDGGILLKVRMVGFCGSDLNSFRGKNPLVTFPRIPGHEVAATILEASKELPNLAPGVTVALSPYMNCGRCAACLRGRPNACQFNKTMGVQVDGALTEFIVVPPKNIYPANLTIKELCIVEPLTVGFHAVARGRVTAEDTVAVFGCGGVGLGAVAASKVRGARTICIDVDDEKLKLARLVGGTDAINSLTEPLHDQLREMTEG